MALADPRAQLLNGHALVSAASRGVTVVAGRDLSPGEVVFASDPVAFVLESQLVSTHCNHCFLSDPDLKRCARCQVAHYCSKNCQTIAWKAYHKHECSMQAELAGLPTPLRDQAALAVRTILAASHEHSAFVDAMFAPEEIDEHLVALASFVRQTLRDHAPDWPAPRIARLLAQGDCNNFSIFTDLLTSQGAGVYPLGALLNHSCVGNCAMMYEPLTHRQLVRCIAPVRKGEELCHSYIDAAGTQAMRQGQLHRYHFVCRCSRCLDASFDLLLAGYRAVPASTSNDEKKSITEETLDAFNASSLPLALTLVVAPPSPETEQELARAEALHAIGSDIRLDGNSAKASLLEALAIRARQLSPFHLDLLATACALQNVAAETQDWPLAARCGVHVAAVYRVIYPPCHPMIGLQLHRLADVHVQLGDLSSARRLYSAALPALMAAYGPTHDYVLMAQAGQAQ
eukprot:m.69499 g.69499  ORF g.69499 m.69499 type:complete len:458 (+) comp12836_c0_seq2:159-1532(+)